MSQGPAAAEPVQPNSQLAQLLMALARPGARLRSTARGASLDGGRAAAGSRKPVVAVAAEIVQAARAAGYLASMPEAQTGACETLNERGRAALRALLVGASAPARGGAKASRQGNRRQAAPPDAGAKRSLERMALVEQLGARRDGRGAPLLEAVQVEAALRFAKDFAIAQMQPRVTARWSLDAAPSPRRRAGPDAGPDLAAATLAARDRMRRALERLGGELADVTLDVCCFEQGLEAIEASRNWPSRTARVVLQIALTRLAEHYGMIVPRREARSFARHWGDDGFKPTVPQAR